MGVNVVWFKRDLRIDDHRALVEAARTGPCLPVYLVETDLWAQPDAARRHRDFIEESLVELDRALRRRGQGLLVLHGDALDCFERLRREYGMTALYAHEETGNGWSFARDRQVRGWCRQHAIALHEYPQFGVVRSLRQRDGWARRWESFMAESASDAPDRLHTVLDTPPPVNPFGGLKVSADAGCAGRQRGGLVRAEAVLADFLERRGQAYRGGISSPLIAAEACSRLSPHIAWGTISLRRVVTAARARRQLVRAAGETRWAASLTQFDRRLHWHCHFIQKLEQRPAIEFENVHSGFDGMRENDFDAERFQAWAEGRTGYPLIDACMRALHHDGWINFRMRAMLMSFAAYPLWLHWREPALHLARLFTDYEPGIHYSQCQMQSGTTGINTLRIYNPVKQARDQDPDGEFVRRWIPELEGVAGEWVFEPWRMSETDRRRTGASGYPRPDLAQPIIDHAAAAPHATQRVTEHRHRPGFGAEADRVRQDLGSRRPGERRRKKPGVDRRQRSLL